MFLCPQVTVKYLKLVKKGKLKRALNLLEKETIDYPEIHIEAIHMSCRYHIITSNEIIIFPIPEKMIQLNILSLAMIDVIYGHVPIAQA